jgi:CRP-like cAMP-binding protein
VNSGAAAAPDKAPDLDVTPLLRTIPLFAGFTDEDLEELGRSLQRRRFAAGTMVMNQGDTGSSMYIVESGECNIHLPGEESRRISLKDIARGEYFGELALFDEMPRSASVLVTTDASLLELGRDTLESFLGRRPQVALTILRTMSARLRETNTMLSARAAKNVDEEFERNLSWSDKLADTVAALNGSWAFILGLIAMTVPVVRRQRRLLLEAAADPYPFAFFNLALAILVGLPGAADRDEPEPAVAQGPRARRHRLQGQPQERGQHRDLAARARRIPRRAQGARAARAGTARAGTATARAHDGRCRALDRRDSEGVL